MSTRQKLLDYGFKEVKKTQGYKLLQLDIDKTGDRFSTALYWYSDQPKKVYITMAKLSGAVTISESAVLENHNELHTGVLENWKAFKESFPEIESAE